jgi:hypothetical protein
MDENQDVVDHMKRLFQVMGSMAALSVISFVEGKSGLFDFRVRHRNLPVWLSSRILMAANLDGWSCLCRGASIGSQLKILSKSNGRAIV